jgi:hypothetical protein
MEGYPALPADLRASIREGSWTFPADIPLVELETRVADRLRSEFDLSDAAVRLDEHARATVNAAPPIGALSRRVPVGKRAVSVTALLPTGLVAGDEVDVVVGEETVSGTVLSATTGAKTATDGEHAATDGGTDNPTTPTAPAATPTTRGGRGRVTLVVSRHDAEFLLGASTVDRLVVNSRGVRREFELLSLLRRSGRRVRKLTVREGGALDGLTLGEASVRDHYGVVVLASRHDGAWRISPRGSQGVAAGDDLFVVGTRDALGAFEEAVA